MFTGIVEEIGTVKNIKHIPGGIKINIAGSITLEDTKIGDSIAVNGVCLTVTQLDKDNFWVDAVGDTLKKTTTTMLKQGAFVNLERAIRLSDRLGGHIVQGHVNAIGKISKITKLGENYSLEIEIPSDIKKYVIDEGSITIEGISLTVASIQDIKVKLSIIPHTWKSTILQYLRIGNSVNIETDIVAKYIENMIKINKDASNDVYSEQWFNKLGY